MKKIEIHKRLKKEKKKLHIWLRAIIQLLFFIFIPSVYTAAFAGVKYIFNQIGARESIELTAFLTILIVICAYTVVFGRFFCGFVCAFGSFGDGVHALYRAVCKKLHKKPVRLGAKLTSWMIYLKYIILILIVGLCFAGVYDRARGTSPWDVFSMLHAGNFQLRDYLPGLIILLVLLVGMCVQERFFCRFFCPLGAIFSFLPVFPFFGLYRHRESCIKGCKACSNGCPADLGLPEEGSAAVQGECFQCQKCIDVCPKSNIHCGIRKLRGNEVLFTLLRAGILLALFLWMGI